jgi:hypothetical protein
MYRTSFYWLQILRFGIGNPECANANCPVAAYRAVSSYVPLWRIIGLAGSSSGIRRRKNIVFVLEEEMMRVSTTIFGLILCSLTLTGTVGAEAAEFQSLFNGKDLAGWEGDPKLWSVVDGAITGTTTEESPLPYNKFLIWTGGTLRNFELRLQLRLFGENNSGIQYRSRRMPEAGEYVVGGYQADVHRRADYNGMLYEERGRGIIARRGQKVIIDANGSKWEVGTAGPVIEVELAEWNEYTILAQGNRLIHKINGQTTVEVIDHQIPDRSLEGILAFQVHRGPAMQVQIRDVRLKLLPEGGVLQPGQTPIPSNASRITGR